MHYLKYEKIYVIILICSLWDLIFFPIFFTAHHSDVLSLIVSISFPVLLGLVIVLSKLSKASIIKFHKLIEVYCNTELYANKAEQISNSVFAFSSTRIIYRYYKIKANYEAGNFQQAYKELMETDIPLVKKYKTIALDYYYILISYYLRIKKMDEALSIFAKLNDIKEKYDKNNKIKSIAEDTYKRAEALIFFNNKQYDKCLDYYSSKYSKSSNTIRVNVKIAYLLGVIYMNDDPERAKAFFNYVLAYGNTLYEVKNAEEHMNAMGAEISEDTREIRERTNANNNRAYTPAKPQMRTLYKYIILTSIVIASIIVPLFYNAAYNKDFSNAMAAKGYTTSSPEYAIEKQLLEMNKEGLEYKYVLLDDYLFVETCSIVDEFNEPYNMKLTLLKTDNGKYDFVSFFNSVSHQFTYIDKNFSSIINITHANNNYEIDLTVFDSSALSGKTAYVYDNTGVMFTSFQYDEASNIWWIKVLDNLPDNYKLYVDVNGTKYELLNKQIIDEKLGT